MKNWEIEKLKNSLSHKMKKRRHEYFLLSKNYKNNKKRSEFNLFLSYYKLKAEIKSWAKFFLNLHNIKIPYCKKYEIIKEVRKSFLNIEGKEKLLRRYIKNPNLNEKSIKIIGITIYYAIQNLPKPEKSESLNGKSKIKNGGQIGLIEYILKNQTPYISPDLATLKCPKTLKNFKNSLKLNTNVEKLIPDSNQKLKSQVITTKKPYTENEVNAVIEEYMKNGPQWAQIVKNPILKSRTQTQIRDKVRNLIKKGILK